LRASEVAPWIGLVAPRLLLRLPYGKGYERVEAFSFEEVAGRTASEGFVWGSGSLATALLLGQAYSAAQGWDLQLQQAREVSDLPAYTHVRADGEREMQACAERYLSDDQAEQMLAAGLMPLASHRQRNAAQLLRWQSVARPPRALAGLQAAA
jgi:predicted component of type VI protein secretion system